MIENKALLNCEITLNIDDVCFLEKPEGQNIIGPIRNRLAKGTRTIKVSKLMEHIERGGSFTPAAMKGTTGSSWVCQQIIVVDVDNTEPVLDVNGKAIKGMKQPVEKPLLSDDALQICLERGIIPSFMYHTFSNSDELERYRIVCILDRPVESAAEGVELTARLSEILDAAAPGAIDPSMADAARLVFGGTKGCIFNVSSFTSIDSLRALPESSKTTTSQQIDFVIRDVQDFAMPSTDSLEYIEMNMSCKWFKSFVEKYNIPVLKTVEKVDRIIYGVACPWSDLHSDDTGKLQSAVLIEANGKLRYVCQHSHCKDKGWKDFRAFYEKAEQAPEVKAQEHLPLMVQASDIEQKVAKFLRAGVPDNNITVIAGDGGVGKSLFECELAAAVSTGRYCLLDPDPDSYAEATQYEPGRVLLFNMEDSFAHIISKRLTDAGADMEMVLTVNPDAEVLLSIADIIDITREYHPKLVIIDPLQAFIPKGIAMERRNDMRRMLAPVQMCADECSAAFLIVMHTNKRFGASGRDRLADSADMWDIARSVFIMGNTHDENKTRYISHEKCSYGQPIKTVLCGIDSKGLYKIGETDRTDYDYIHDRDKHAGGRPPVKRAEAEQIILDALDAAGGSMTGKQLAAISEQNDIADKTFRNAKNHLIETEQIERQRIGSGKAHSIIYSLME